MKILGFNIGRGATAPRNEMTPSSPPPSPPVPATAGPDGAGVHVQADPGSYPSGDGSLARSDEARRQRFAATPPAKVEQAVPPTQPEASETEQEQMARIVKEVMTRFEKNAEPNPSDSAIKMAVAMRLNAEKFAALDKKKPKASFPGPAMVTPPEPPKDPRIVKYSSGVYRPKNDINYPVHSVLILEILKYYSFKILKLAVMEPLMTPTQRESLRGFLAEFKTLINELQSNFRDSVRQEIARKITENEQAASTGEVIPHDNLPLPEDSHKIAEQKRYNLRWKQRSLSQRRFDQVYRPAFERLQEIALQVAEHVDRLEREAHFSGTGFPFMPSRGLLVLCWFATTGCMAPVKSFRASSVDGFTFFLTPEIIGEPVTETAPQEPQLPTNAVGGLNPIAAQMLENQRNQKAMLAAKGIKA